MGEITIDLDKLGEVMASKILLPSAVPLEKTPWGAKKCAAHLEISVSHFLQNIAPRPDFPKSRRIGDGHRKWKASEVTDWVMAHWDRPERNKAKK